MRHPEIDGFKEKEAPFIGDRVPLGDETAADELVEGSDAVVARDPAEFVNAIQIGLACLEAFLPSLSNAFKSGVLAIVELVFGFVELLGEFDLVGITVMGPAVIAVEGGEDFQVFGNAPLGLDDAALVSIVIGVQACNINELGGSSRECRCSA